MTLIHCKCSSAVVQVAARQSDKRMTKHSQMVFVDTEADTISDNPQDDTGQMQRKQRRMHFCVCGTCSVHCAHSFARRAFQLHVGSDSAPAQKFAKRIDQVSSLCCRWLCEFASRACRVVVMGCVLCARMFSEDWIFRLSCFVLLRVLLFQECVERGTVRWAR